MEQINIFTSFTGGVLSFLSPCVLPLLPLYLSYLGIKKGKLSDNLKMMSGFCFGIMSVFILLTLGVKAVTPFIVKYQTVITIIGGCLLIVLGLHQFGFIEIKIFSKEKRINTDIDKMSFVKAYALGFIYSVSWTPCISPVITTIVALSLTSFNSLSWLYILVYGLGFTLPFIILGLVFKGLINNIRKYQQVFNTLMKVFAAAIIMIGCYMIYDASNAITVKPSDQTFIKDTDGKYLYVTGIERYDQHGNLIKLKDYKGKYLLITFSATWCTYCNQQEAFMEEYAKNHDNIIPFVVMADYINLSSGGITIDEYAKDKTIPVLTDDGTLFYEIGAQSFPLNLFVGPDGSVVASFAGAIMDEDTMDNVFIQIKDLYESR